MMETLDLVIPGFCGMGMHLRLDGFRLLYVCIAVIMWTASGLFSLEYMRHYKSRKVYYVFLWLTFGATAGVFLSADLYTTFIFFEIMSFTSYVWVAFDQREESLRAAQTYLAVAVIGGLMMLMGLFLLYDLLGTLEMDELCSTAAGVLEEGKKAQVGKPGGFTPQVRLYTAAGLLLFGFGAKAGVFPLHIWLPKAHPVAPAPASALLSGILTKTGMFGIIAVTCNLLAADDGWGLVLTALGFATMLTGAALALFSVNLKRALACSSVSQIGFILTGIGMCCLLMSAGEDGSMAARGALLHMVNHSLFKLVLFLCAGVVFMNLHQLDLNEIRGFGRHKPALCICFLMGALGISGFPGLSGYVSKTLLHESIVEYGAAAGTGLWKAAEWVFLTAGGMTFAYMTKLFIAIFIEKNPSRQEEFDAMSGSYMSPLSRWVLVSCAAAIPALGILPHRTMDRLAAMGQGFFRVSGPVHETAYFSAGNLAGALISVGAGSVLYIAVVRGMTVEKKANQPGIRRYVDRMPQWLDLERLVYRPLLETALPGIFGAVCGFVDRYFVSAVVQVFLALASVLCRFMDKLADSLILLARKTTHRQTATPHRAGGPDWPARILGAAFDHMAGLWHRGASKKSGKGQRPAALLFAEKEEMLKRTGRLVEESFSFGLMLFCIGLCLTLGYLLFVFFRG